MQKGVFGAISRWSLDELPAEELAAVLRASQVDIVGHREGFGAVAARLEERQRQRCEQLIDYAFSLIDLLDWELNEALQALQCGDKGRVISAGDQMARASYQLNQTFVELTHQALRALGPTEIPNFNHLLALRKDYLKHPGEPIAGLMREAFDAERVLATRSLQDLTKEPDLPEVVTLRRAFVDHLASLEQLSARLHAPCTGSGSDLSGLDALEKSFGEISSLMPIVQMKLRGQGETKFPDLNLLLKLLDDLEEGRVGDVPVMGALESIESSFTATARKCELAVGAEPSVLIAQEIRATLESFDVFSQGLDAVYRFLEERDTRWLARGRGLLREFGGRFLTHQQRLEQLREQQTKVLCPYCSHFNERGQARCRRCAKPLPLNLGLPDGSTTFSFVERGPAPSEEKLLVTSNLIPVYQAAKAVDEGSIDVPTFLAVLDRFQVTLESGVERVPDEPKGASSAVDVYNLLDDGVEELFAGLESMRRYPDALDQSVLLEGIRKLDSGAKKVTRAGADAARTRT